MGNALQIVPNCINRTGSAITKPPKAIGTLYPRIFDHMRWKENIEMNPKLIEYSEVSIKLLFFNGIVIFIR